ncbi:hypothetical protein Plhal710r2_c054g0161911 [Plasmopara halstedii]
MGVRLLLALIFAITLHACSMALPAVNDLNHMKAGNATQSTSTDYGSEERGMAGVEAVTEAGKTRILGFKAPKWWEKFLEHIMPTLRYNRDRVSRFFTFIKELFLGQSKNAKALKKNSSVKTVEAKPDPPPVVAPVPPKKLPAPASAPVPVPASASASAPASASTTVSAPVSAPVSSPASLEPSASTLQKSTRWSWWKEAAETPVKAVPKSGPGDTVSKNTKSWFSVMKAISQWPKKSTTAVTEQGDSVLWSESAEKSQNSVPKRDPSKTISKNAEVVASLVKPYVMRWKQLITPVTKEGDAVEKTSPKSTSYLSRWPAHVKQYLPSFKQSTTPVKKEEDAAKSFLQMLASYYLLWRKTAVKPHEATLKSDSGESTTPVTKEGDATESNIQKLKNFLFRRKMTAEKPHEAAPKSDPGEIASENAESWYSYPKKFFRSDKQSTTPVTKEGVTVETSENPAGFVPSISS